MTDNFLSFVVQTKLKRLSVIDSLRHVKLSFLIFCLLFNYSAAIVSARVSTTAESYLV